MTLFTVSISKFDVGKMCCPVSHQKAVASYTISPVLALRIVVPPKSVAGTIET